MPKRSEQHMAEQRQRILSAALRCHRERGFHRTSISDICKAAGLSVGAVYTHFKNKRSIMLALADQSLAILNDTRIETMQGLRQFVMSGIEDLEKPQREQQARSDFQIMQLSLHHKKLQQRVRAALRALEEVPQRSLQVLQARGEVACSYDVRVGAATLGSILTAAWLTKAIAPEFKLSVYKECVAVEFARMVPRYGGGEKPSRPKKKSSDWEDADKQPASGPLMTRRKQARF